MSYRRACSTRAVPRPGYQHFARTPFSIADKLLAFISFSSHLYYLISFVIGPTLGRFSPCSTYWTVASHPESSGPVHFDYHSPVAHLFVFSLLKKLESVPQRRNSLVLKTLLPFYILPSLRVHLASAPSQLPFFCRRPLSYSYGSTFLSIQIHPLHCNFPERHTSNLERRILTVSKASKVCAPTSASLFT